MADTLLAALTETSAPDFSDYTLWEDNTGPTSGKISVGRLIGLLYRPVCMGRLTLETGVPVSTTDQTGKSTLYWTPIDAGYISLYDGTRWVGFKQAEMSLALSGLTADKQYDAFVDWNSGTPQLVLGPAWTNDTTRATGLTTQDGIQVLSGTVTKRYVGTIRTTGTTTTEDSAVKRYVWNYYNQRQRYMDSGFVSDSHAYTSAAYREWNGGSNSTRLQFVVGVLPAVFQASLAVNITAGGAQVTTGIGVDSTTGTSTAFFSPAINTISRLSSSTPGRITAIGYHFLAVLEYGGAGATFTDYDQFAVVLT